MASIRRKHYRKLILFSGNYPGTLLLVFTFYKKMVCSNTSIQGALKYSDMKSRK